MSNSLVLRTALDVAKYKGGFNSPVSENRIRATQYKMGIDAFKALVPFDQFDNVYLVDNTIRSSLDIDPEILDSLPPSCKIIITNTNKFGKYNKGSGDVETYRYMFNSKILSEGFIIHFEPRLLLFNSDIFDSFLQNNRSLLNLSPDGKGIQTGYMFLKTEEMKDFCSLPRLLEMTIGRQSIENHMLEFATNKDIELKRNYTCAYRIDPLTRSKIPY